LANPIISQLDWVLEYLGKYFPGQPFPARTAGADMLIVEVNDSSGRSKELRIQEGFLRANSKSTIQEYLEDARIADQLESVPSSVSIKQLAR
jgi:hypothetical protein